MKFELKNLKISEELSEETTAFTATVYVDGKRAFTAKDRGCGGEVEFSPLVLRDNSGYDPASKKILDKAYKFARNMPKEDGIPMSLDFLVSILVEKTSLDKILTQKTVKLLKMVTILRELDPKDADDTGISSFKEKAVGADFKKWENYIKAQDYDAVILNALPSEDAKKLIKSIINGNIQLEDRKDIVAEILIKNGISDERVENLLKIELYNGPR